MNFTEFVSAMFGPLKRIADFSGRSTRPEFWPFIFLIYAAQQIVSFIAINPVMQKLQKLNDPFNPLPPEQVGAELTDIVTHGACPMFLLFVGLGVVSMLLMASAVVRRLHDGNRSGFHALPVPLFQIAGVWMLWLVIEEMFAASTIQIPKMLLPLVINNFVGLGVTIYVIVLCARDGTIGPNRYGEDPKGRTVEEEEARKADRDARFRGPSVGSPPPVTTRPITPARIIDGDGQ